VATVPSIGRAVGQTVGTARQPAEATRDLYERYGRQIFAYCVVQLRNREDAEDAVQTTFLNAFRGLESGIVPELESAWLYKIAQNVCLTRRRSWSRRRSVESPENFDTVQELIGSPMRDTDDFSELTDALRTLPEQQRRAILLREWQGLTYKEIATEMQLSQAAVETLIFRARRSLAVAIERLRASGDVGSIFAAIKSLLLGFGTKAAVAVVTVATTSVVAATPQARQNLVHFVDAVSNVAMPSAKPTHPHHVARSVPIAAPAAPAATAKHRVKTVGHSTAVRHATPVQQRMTKNTSVQAAAAAAAPAAAAATPAVQSVKPSQAQAPAPAKTTLPAVVTQPVDTTPTPAPAPQTTTTPVKTASGTGDTAQTKTTPSTVAPVAPSVNSFSPSSGPVGTYVQVGGQNFTGATGVMFNGTSAPFSVSSDGQLMTKVPDGATSGPITVVTPNGRTASGDSFSVSNPTSTTTSTTTSTAVPAPTISGTSPQSGAVGTSVGIGGHNFTGATAVRFNGTSADVTVSSDGVIMTHVPSGATTGPITVVTTNGTGTSSADFTVTGPAAPTIDGPTPSNGPVGTTVQVIGHNFTGATAVKFNGVAASFSITSDSQITAQVPSGATSGPISVTTPNGTASSSRTFTVTGTVPEINGFTPGSGTAGASVGISGLHFTGATSVTFNGVPATFVVNSDTSIGAVVPSGATSGTITVTTPSGTATSSGSFTVTH
jgi:RNA polymerase sigma factor (sigma-70 family)